MPEPTPTPLTIILYIKAYPLQSFKNSLKVRICINEPHCDVLHT